MDSRLEEILTVFNRVLARMGQRSLTENPEFIVDNQLTAPFFIRCHSVPKPGRIEMSFELTSSGATFWIDKTQEMPDISYDMIKQDVVRFEEIIEMIFSSTIHAEYKGRTTVLSFINADNIVVGKYNFHSGLWPDWFSSKTTKIYDPYFED